MRLTPLFLCLALVMAPFAFAQDASDPETKTLAERESGREGYQWGHAFRPDVERALDTSNKDTYRLRAFDEIGRFGDKGMVPRLKTALADESADIRIATMRAMMRLGVDGAEGDLLGMLKNQGSSSKERAWAARALSRSKQSSNIVPELIANLRRGKDTPAAGERAATVESLRRMTGLSLGARPKTLFTSFVGEESQDTTDYAEKWEEWWRKNKDLNPDQWMQNALGSEIPKDRASAARMMAAKGDMGALPFLLKAFDREGEKEGKSGVREAIAKQIEKLTGIRPKYSPFLEEGQSRDEWEEQHRAAQKAWTSFDKAVKAGKSPIDLKLADKSPRTRATTLRGIKFKDRESITLKAMIERLEDPSTQVAEAAWGALVRTTGVAFPLDFGASAGLQKVQIARWKEWGEAFATSTPAERLLTLFREDRDMRWGLSAANGDKALEEAAWEDFEKKLISMRSRAMAYIARHDMVVPSELLIKFLRDEIRNCKEALDNPKSGLRGVNTMLQRNLVIALSRSNDSRVPSLILERLQVAEDAQRLRSHQGALNDLDVVKACVQTLGQIGNLPSATPKLRDLTKRTEETRFTVRARAAKALGECGGEGERNHLKMMIDDKSERALVRIGAIDGIAALARRYPSLNPGIRIFLYNLYHETKDADHYPVVVRDAARKSWKDLEIPSSD